MLLAQLACFKVSWRSGDKVALGAVVLSIIITISVMCVDFEERHVKEAE